MPVYYLLTSECMHLTLPYVAQILKRKCPDYALRPLSPPPPTHTHTRTKPPWSPHIPLSSLPTQITVGVIILAINAAYIVGVLSFSLKQSIEHARQMPRLLSESWRSLVSSITRAISRVNIEAKYSLTRSRRSALSSHRPSFTPVTNKCPLDVLDATSTGSNELQPQEPLPKQLHQMISSNQRK